MIVFDKSTHAYTKHMACRVFYSMHRDQSGNCCQSGGHREHPAVPADAEILEGKALGVETTGTMPAKFTYVNEKLN